MGSADTDLTMRHMPVQFDSDDESTRIAYAPPNERFGEYLVRRCIDVTFSATVLVLTAPIMATLAIVIRLDSPGPALFRQTRMTRCRRRRPGQRPEGGERRSRHMSGRPFTFYKFRTMYVDARERFPELYAYSYTPEEIKKLRFKRENDPRLTRVGRWLRKTSLDELPNFWNALKGDMTLVGPRPEIPEMSPYYGDEHRRKFSVPAGVTGPAQVSGRGQLSFIDTIELDCRYVDQRSLWSDVSLLARTIYAVVTRRGAF